MLRIYLDTEYCYPGMVPNTPRPTAADTRQIVQIAAILYDTAQKQEIASFNQLAKPTYETQLPDFFTQLTSISQDMVDRSGKSFQEVFDEFVAFCGDIPIWTFDKDEEVLRQNCSYVASPWPLTEPFTRVKPLLPQWDVDPDAYSSGTLYKAAGLNLEGHVHDALHDVRSMAQSISVFEEASKHSN